MCRLIVKSRRYALHHQKTIPQNANLLEEVAVLIGRFTPNLVIYSPEGQLFLFLLFFLHTLLYLISSSE